MDIPDGLPGMSISKTGDEDPITTVEWLGSRPDVSAVAVDVGGTPIGWQTPIGGVISMRIDYQPGSDVTLTAYDIDGNILNTLGPWTIIDIDNPPTD